MTDTTPTGRGGLDSPDVRVLRTLFDHLPAMIAYWNRDGENVVANDAYVEWFGFHPDDMPGVHISTVLGPELYAKNLPFIKGALAGEEQLFDRTLIDQAGRTRHTQASYVPDVVDGVVHGFYVLVTDVTPRVEAQRAMDEAQALAKLGSWTLNTATGAVTWSKELFNIVGVPPGEDPPVLTTLSELIHPEDRARVLANIDRATSTGQHYTIDYRIVRSDGSVREVVSNGRPVSGPDGQVLSITGTLQDVTEANILARELARTNTELRRANELNADVIAMLGHDIRSPLGAIHGYLELLVGEWDTLADDVRRGFASRALGSTDRVGTMVERLLAAVDAGAIEPRPEQLDLPSVLAEIVDAFGLTGRILIDATASTGTFDRVHLEQIVGNLLVNADRYGADPIRITTRNDHSQVTIAVSDGGPGVPAALTDRLFARFARTGPDQTVAGGTGFGLYMSAELAEANGGTLTYQPSRDDLPHAFILALPAADSGQSAAHVVAEHRQRERA